MSPGLAPFVLRGESPYGAGVPRPLAVGAIPIPSRPLPRFFRAALALDTVSRALLTRTRVSAPGRQGLRLSGALVCPLATARALSNLCQMLTRERKPGSGFCSAPRQATVGQLRGPREPGFTWESGQ